MRARLRFTFCVKFLALPKRSQVRKDGASNLRIQAELGPWLPANAAVHELRPAPAHEPDGQIVAPPGLGLPRSSVGTSCWLKAAK
jgi:hypothetical protein